MTMDETRQVSELLNRLATEMAVGGRLPSSLRKRARLAMIRNAFAAVLVVAVGTTASVAVVGNFREHRSVQRPAANEAPADVIAYASDADGDTDVYTTALGGDVAVNLTHNDASDQSPTWSPDGSEIAFSSDRGGTWAIYVMEADGSNVHRVADDGTHPDWSPDGSSIAFSRAGSAAAGEGLSQICVLNLATGATEQVTRDEAGALQADWSPDGTHLAYSGQQARIVVSTPSGSNPRLVTQEYGDMNPVWTPDGSALLFSRETSFANDTSFSDIFRVDAAGGTTQRLTNAGSGTSLVPQSFSADGDRLLVTMYEDGKGDVYTMNADGSGLSPVVSGPADDAEPEWRP
jgi:Tol biopolymer transport system component